MKLFIRRTSLVISGIFFSNFVFYYIIGVINKTILNHKIESIFLVYPANKKYTKAYSFDWYLKFIKWSPSLVGFYKQNDKWGLIFGISSSDEDFFCEKNKKMLKLLTY